jgi:hypothetical protein
MPNKVNIVRPDGTVLQATPEQAERLKLLGYREESFGSRNERNIEQAQSDYYTTTGEKVKAGFEGLASGATLGASDYLLGDDDTKKRAQYNPGTRMATEALGALVPLVLTDGAGEAALAARGADEAGLAYRAGEVASKMPSSLLSRGVAAAIPGEGLTQTVVRGALEGGVYGGTSEVDHAYLSGDPLTAESVLHGVGWGAVFGGGLGAVSHAAQEYGVKTAKALVEEKNISSGADLVKVGDQAYGELAGEVRGLKNELRTSIAQADGTVKAVFTKVAEQQKATSKFEFLAQRAEAGGEMLPEAEDFISMQKLHRTYKGAMEAAAKGQGTKALEAIKEFEGHINKVGGRFGMVSDLGNSAQAMKSLATLRSVQRELSTLPGDATKFASMSPEKSHRVFAALEEAVSLKDFPNVSEAVKASVDNFTQALGFKGEGVTGLRKAQEALRTAKGAVDRAGAGAAKSASKPSLVRQALSYAIGGEVYRAAKATGGGMWLSLLAAKGAKNMASGKSLAAGLSGTRNLVVSRVRAAAAKYLPGSAGKLKISALSRTEPLIRKLDGTVDDAKVSREEMANRRIKEMYRAAPSIKDTLYRAVEPLHATQPELAPAIHQAGVDSFMAMMEFLPKDPGAISRLQSLWTPDRVETEMFSRRYEAFHDPVGVAERMLESGQFDPIRVETIKACAPAIYNELRVSCLEHITENGLINKMSYNDQCGMSAMLDLPLHSTMMPHFIASQQELFTQRNQPLPTPTPPGQSGGGNGGRPPGPDQSSNSTSAQRLTEH